ncbi:MATE family efflux transporter [Virgibacillus halodenitrificans]|uniref:Multidrug export protein MepA n=1 Tax=Virgibacillus halodenitrificans TaxID=1482 RepID=A0ABR7VSB7_VIRHA|nr:MATE family efflux transporter [Virgibacillus halodenitrificans]MBD1224788.1 MATE family efflux transporter [Virgibacillus halodenitrificans]
MSIAEQKLGSQGVVKSFFQYFIPTILGMMLMSVNIVIDGIFVGNGIGSVALASINVAVPVWSVIISISLLIGIGGGTLYSMATGAGKGEEAKQIFTTSMVLITVSISIIGGVSYLASEQLANLFGANEETLPYAVDYLQIIFLSSVIISWENVVSIFLRNDGAPKLAMTGLIVSAILNIVLNYWMIFVLDWEVKGAALATVLATVAGLFVYLLHFFNRNAGLRFTRVRFKNSLIRPISKLGFPNFLSEAGTGVFVMGYNLGMAYCAGTTGLAAFSVINYLHTFMFLAFIGIGSSIQPMISYYYGAKKFNAIKETVKIAEITGFGLGILFIIIGYVGSDFLVSIFGVATEEIRDLAISGIKLFFIGYLFMGTNFIYMTYYQSIGYVRPSIWITLFRGFILLIASLLILPVWFGTTGIWLALPISEGLVAIVLLIYARKEVMKRKWNQRVQ